MGCGTSSKPVSTVSTATPVVQAEGVTASIHKEYDGGADDCSKYFSRTINPKSPLVRLNHIEASKKIPVKGSAYNAVLKFCYVSQRGYYPDSLGKANQDTFVICESILGNKSCNLFGVFDGHGEDGDHCSYFAADQLSINVAKELKKDNGILSLNDEVKMEAMYTNAFLQTNFDMHATNDFDDNMSGTTGVTVLQNGDQLLIANVGDSRAIIACEDEGGSGRLVYSPLSSDQTPYRKDERERLKLAGARVMTIDQIEGNEPMHENFGTDLGEEIDEGGDPPRVWDATLEQPGCAFSRSIGDAIAKKVGVTAQPEILCWHLSPRDKFLVVASDGVFEFITSQQVVDMIAKFDDPLEAAKHVVAEAYRLWLTYDDRTDDITIIIVEFHNITEVKSISSSTAGAGVATLHSTPSVKGQMPGLTRAKSMSKTLSKEALYVQNSRPVRKVMSKAKRMEVTEMWDDHDDKLEFNFDSVVNDKTQEEIARISKMLSNNFMLENLSAIQKDQIFKVMVAKPVKAGDRIITEGERGDEMYIIDSGLFEVYKKNDAGEEELVFTYSREGSAFGELSLMYGKPRGASVIAKTDGKLWSIGRPAFRAVIMKGKQEGLLDVYQTIPVLKDLSVPTLQRLCMRSKEVLFEKGDLVASPTNVDRLSWCFAVVVTGILRLIPKDPNKKRQLRAELTYFSIDEVGSKFKEVKADTKTKLMCIPRKVYQDILGLQGVDSMKDQMLRTKTKGMRLRPTLSMFIKEDNLNIEKIEPVSRFELQSPSVILGEFGHVGLFKDSSTGSYCSIKVVAKAPCIALRMDARMLHERNFLAAILNADSQQVSDVEKTWFPTVVGTMQSEKQVYLVYKDIYACDLAFALQNNAVKAEDRPYYAAGIYSAVRSVHDYGLMHRYINPEAVYITAMGVPMLCDFRYAKRLDGSRSFTICGNPLYFAPEIVTSKGYDHSADLWALGVLFYELYERKNPFALGDSCTEESIFKAITGYSWETLRLSDDVSATESGANLKLLLKGLLQVVPHKRIGYVSYVDIHNAEYFNDIDWAELQVERGRPVELETALDHDNILDESKLEPCSSANFLGHF